MACVGSLVAFINISAVQASMTSLAIVGCEAETIVALAIERAVGVDAFRVVVAVMR